MADTIDIPVAPETRDRLGQPWWEHQPAPAQVDLARVPLAAQPELVIRAERV